MTLATDNPCHAETLAYVRTIMPALIRQHAHDNLFVDEATAYDRLRDVCNAFDSTLTPVEPLT